MFVAPGSVVAAVGGAMPATSSSLVVGELPVQWRPLDRCPCVYDDMFLLVALCEEISADLHVGTCCRHERCENKQMLTCLFNIYLYVRVLDLSYRRRPGHACRRRTCRDSVLEPFFISVHERDDLQDGDSGGAALRRHSTVHLPGEEKVFSRDFRKKRGSASSVMVAYSCCV